MDDARATIAPRRGRRPAASRDDVLEAALHRYLRGRRIDVRAIAGELGLGRTTIYRWFGSREGLVGEAVATAAEPLFDEARASARGRGGAALLDTFDRINRGLATAPALRSFLELERDALRILTSSAGVVQPRAVAKIQGFIDDEVRTGGYVPPVDPRDARLCDRAPRGSLPLQRRDRRDARRGRPPEGDRGRASGRSLAS